MLDELLLARWILGLQGETRETHPIQKPFRGGGKRGPARLRHVGGGGGFDPVGGGGVGGAAHRPVRLVGGVDSSV